VSAEPQVNASMTSARQAMGRIDVLVNCAGIIGAGKLLGRDGPMAGAFLRPCCASICSEPSCATRPPPP